MLLLTPCLLCALLSAVGVVARRQSESVSQSQTLTSSCVEPTSPCTSIYYDPRPANITYNATVGLSWDAIYNASVISCSTTTSSNGVPQFQYWVAECSWTLSCQSVKNGSLVIRSFQAIPSKSSESLSNAQVYPLMEYFLIRNENESKLVFAVYNATYSVGGGNSNEVVLTKNASEVATLRIRVRSPYTFNGAVPKPNWLRLAIQVNFVCVVFSKIIILPPIVDRLSSQKDIFFLALIIPISLVVAIGAVVCLIRKYQCCSNESLKNEAQKKSLADDEHLSKTMSQPLIADRAGMQTWLDQAEEVLADLNERNVGAIVGKDEELVDNDFGTTLVMQTPGTTNAVRKGPAEQLQTTVRSPPVSNPKPTPTKLEDYL